MFTFNEITLNVIMVILIGVSSVVKNVATVVISVETGETMVSIGSSSDPGVNPVYYKLRMSKSSPIWEALSAGRSEPNLDNKNAQERFHLDKSTTSDIPDNDELFISGTNLSFNKTKVTVTNAAFEEENSTAPNANAISNDGRNISVAAKNSSIGLNTNISAIQNSVISDKYIQNNSENAANLAVSSNDTDPQRQNLRIKNPSEFVLASPFYTILNGQVFGSINLSPKTGNLNSSNVFGLTLPGKRENTPSKEDDEDDVKTGPAPSGAIAKVDMPYQQKTWMTPQLKSPSGQQPTIVNPMEKRQDISSLSNGESIAIINNFMDFLKVFQHKLDNMNDASTTTLSTITPESTFSVNKKWIEHRDAGIGDEDPSPNDQQKQFDSSSVNSTNYLINDLNKMKQEDKNKYPLENYNVNKENPLEKINENIENPLEKTNENVENPLEKINQNNENPLEKINQNDENPLEKINENDENPLEKINQNDENPLEKINQNDENRLEKINQNDENPLEKINQNDENPLEKINQNDENRLEKINQNDENPLEKINQNDENPLEKINQNDENPLEKIKQNDENYKNPFEKNNENDKNPLVNNNENDEESKYDKIVLLTQALEENNYEDNNGGKFSSESEGSKDDKIVLLTQALEENNYEDNGGGKFSSESEGSQDESFTSQSEEEDYDEDDWTGKRKKHSYRNIDEGRWNYRRLDSNEKRNKTNKRQTEKEFEDSTAEIFEFSDDYFEPIRERAPVQRPAGKPKRGSNRRKNSEKIRFDGGFSTLNCKCGYTSNTRIVGGKDSHISRHPWIAQLVVTLEGSPFCGGSLINDRHILTAAHCLKGKNVEELYVKMGSTSSNKGEAFPVASYIMHPMYNKTDVTKYDIALIRIEEPILEFSSSISPVCLPTGEGRNRDLTKGIVAGFGRLTEEGPQSGNLQEARVIIMESSACGVNSKYSENQLNPMVLCAKGDKIDSCQGDSGGPLVRKIGDQHVQVGITSWGIGCAREGYPGIYTKVASYISWLQEHTAEAAYCHRSMTKNRLVMKPQDPIRNEDFTIMREFLQYVAQKLQATEEP